MYGKARRPCAWHRPGTRTAICEYSTASRVSAGARPHLRPGRWDVGKGPSAPLAPSLPLLLARASSRALAGCQGVWETQLLPSEATSSGSRAWGQLTVCDRNVLLQKQCSPSSRVPTTVQSARGRRTGNASVPRALPARPGQGEGRVSGRCAWGRSTASGFSRTRQPLQLSSTRACR